MDSLAALTQWLTDKRQADDLSQGQAWRDPAALAREQTLQVHPSTEKFLSLVNAPNMIPGPGPKAPQRVAHGMARYRDARDAVRMQNERARAVKAADGRLLLPGIVAQTESLLRVMPNYKKRIDAFLEPTGDSPAIPLGAGVDYTTMQTGPNVVKMTPFEPTSRHMHRQISNIANTPDLPVVPVTREDFVPRSRFGMVEQPRANVETNENRIYPRVAKLLDASGATGIKDYFNRVLGLVQKGWFMDDAFLKNVGFMGPDDLRIIDYGSLYQLSPKNVESMLRGMRFDQEQRDRLSQRVPINTEDHLLEHHRRQTGLPIR